MTATKNKPAKKATKKANNPTANSQVQCSYNPVMWIRIEYGEQNSITDVTTDPKFPREKIEGFLMDIVKAIKPK